jgi:hypothetical protein
MWIRVLRILFNYKLTILYVLLAILSLSPFIIGFRRGFKLVKIDKQDKNQRSWYKWILPAGVVVLFSLLLKYYTHNWHNILIGNAVGFIAWGFYYYFSNRSKLTTGEGQKRK